MSTYGQKIKMETKYAKIYSYYLWVPECQWHIISAFLFTPLCLPNGLGEESQGGKPGKPGTEQPGRCERSCSARGSMRALGPMAQRGQQTSGQTGQEAQQLRQEVMWHGRAEQLLGPQGRLSTSRLSACDMLPRVTLFSPSSMVNNHSSEQSEIEIQRWWLFIDWTRFPHALPFSIHSHLPVWSFPSYKIHRGMYNLHCGFCPPEGQTRCRHCSVLAPSKESPKAQVFFPFSVHLVAFLTVCEMEHSLPTPLQNWQATEILKLIFPLTLKLFRVFLFWTHIGNVLILFLPFLPQHPWPATVST